MTTDSQERKASDSHKQGKISEPGLLICSATESHAGPAGTSFEGADYHAILPHCTLTLQPVTHSSPSVAGLQPPLSGLTGGPPSPAAGSFPFPFPSTAVTDTQPPPLPPPLPAPPPSLCRETEGDLCKQRHCLFIGGTRQQRRCRQMDALPQVFRL